MSLKSKQTLSLKDEMNAYEQMRDTLEIDHLGKWVIFHGGKLIGTYDDFQDAAETAVENFGRGPYLIKRVGEGPISLPASVLYGHVHA